MGGKMADNALTHGIELYKQKKYTDALTFFLSISADTGTDSLEIVYYLGLTYTKLARYEDAIVYLEQVVTSSENDNKERVLQCRFILAMIYSISGRKRLATFELSQLLDSGYKRASVYAALAYISWEQKDIEQCIDYYELSLLQDPDNVTALNGIGYVLACEEKDLARALSCCKKAVEASPDSAACLDSLGWVYYKLGLSKEAKKYLEMAGSIDNSKKEIAEHLNAVYASGV